MRFLGVVDEPAYALSVLLKKVIGGIRQRLRHSLADGDAGNDDDEFVPAVALIQFEESLDVAIGFARAGLHLNIEIDVGNARSLQLRGDWKVLTGLNVLNVLEDILRWQYEVCVTEPLVHLQYLCLP